MLAQGRIARETYIANAKATFASKEAEKAEAQAAIAALEAQLPTAKAAVEAETAVEKAEQAQADAQADARFEAAITLDGFPDADVADVIAELAIGDASSAEGVKKLVAAVTALLPDATIDVDPLVQLVEQVWRCLWGCKYYSRPRSVSSVWWCASCCCVLSWLWTSDGGSQTQLWKRLDCETTPLLECMTCRTRWTRLTTTRTTVRVKVRARALCPPLETSRSRCPRESSWRRSWRSTATRCRPWSGSWPRHRCAAGSLWCFEWARTCDIASSMVGD